MPGKPEMKLALAEWRTVLEASRYYRDYLDRTAEAIEDENQQLVAFDHLQRLERIIPSLEKQMDEQLAASDHEPAAGDPE